MTEERKAQLKQLRQRLANLSESEKQALAARGMIVTVQGRTLSLHNTILVYLQANGNAPTVVGGYHQWKLAGRQVKKGKHGYIIWFPLGNKDDNGDLVESPERFFSTTVFDITQTEERKEIAKQNGNTIYASQEAHLQANLEGNA